ncbi:MAG: hypothetical protein KDD62_15050, partial [Bdellovibrionales bacterium]|nr:hypothetical protein [Bdellovibrionales bacterium]
MNTNASEERLVVTCPACETKFAVVRSALSQVATPRFHCSRCDNVFVVSVDQLSTLEPQATSEDNFEPEVEEPEAFEEIPHKANPTSPMFPQPDEYQGVESDMGEAAQKANPTTELNETKEIKQALGKIADEPVSEFIAVPSMGAAEYQNADDRAFKPEKPNPHYAEQAGLFDSIDDEDERYRDADSSPEFLATQDDIAEMQVVRKHSPWRACIFISAPIALCLVGLFVISIAVKQFPDLLSPYIPSSIAALPN